MSPKIAYFLAALLAILCLLQQFESTTAANTGLSREELAARRQLQQNTNNQLNKNQYNNEDVDDEDDDDVVDEDDDDDEAEDGSDAEDEDEANNLALRDEISENVAQAQEQNISKDTEVALANSEEGTDVGGRARRRGRRGGRGRRRRAGRRRGRRGGRRRGSRKGLRKVRKSRKHSSG